MPPRGRAKSKNPPMLSQEFIIQNHADIVSCVAMLFVVGLMFQVTAPLASTFVAMQHNVTSFIEGEEEDHEMWHYTYGLKDMCAIFFYFLICIVMHAVIQEYMLDKVNRKMHLSKVKNSKFNESGQLLTFYLVSCLWGMDIIYRENYVPNISHLWDRYPVGHAQMTFSYKLFFIIQLSYWLHNFPELYFQKVKKEEIPARIQYTMLYLFFIGVAYMLNFTRIAMFLAVLHFAVECVFHVARLAYFSDKLDFANTCFMLWNVLFVLVRLGSITVAVLTFWYGLKNYDMPTVDFAAGNFNIPVIRVTCLVSVLLLQGWLMWNFITFHLRRVREAAQATSATSASQSARRVQKPQGKNRKKRAVGDDGRRKDEDDVDDLPEVDQSQVRARKVASK